MCLTVLNCFQTRHLCQGQLFWQMLMPLRLQWQLPMALRLTDRQSSILRVIFRQYVRWPTCCLEMVSLIKLCHFKTPNCRYKRGPVKWKMSDSLFLMSAAGLNCFNWAFIKKSSSTDMIGCFDATFMRNSGLWALARGLWMRFWAIPTNARPKLDRWS